VNFGEKHMSKWSQGNTVSAIIEQAQNKNILRD
jgi:hypothetical protein